jgi:hypothetical protein
MHKSTSIAGMPRFFIPISPCERSFNLNNLSERLQSRRMWGIAPLAALKRTPDAGRFGGMGKL